MAYINEDYGLAPGYAVANGASNAVVSKVIPIRLGDSPVVVDIKVASGTGTAKIQDSSDGFTTVNTKKTVAISGAGTFSITLLANLAGDQTYYPLRNAARIVMDTTADMVISEIRVMHEK